MGALISDPSKLGGGQTIQIRSIDGVWRDWFVTNNFPVAKVVAVVNWITDDTHILPWHDNALWQNARERLE